MRTCVLIGCFILLLFLISIDENFLYRLEATLVERIAEHIHKKKIKKLPSSTKNLVGIPSRVQEVIRHVGIGLNDVRFIGIWGMGGTGKTTIARVVYEAIQGKFEVSCFLANVREVCAKDNIVQMQKELVAQANINAGNICNKYDGKRIIQDALCNKKVLLVLDDVSHEVQLRNLAGEQDWFGPGSRIIITTRDEHLLKIQEVHETYKVQGLAPNESFDLFCLNAFKQKKPIEGYLDLSKEVVKYSHGLPLALEVLGSHLYRKPLDVWHSAIKKIKSTPFAEIDDILKISYKGLDFMEKNIFLDIACFFKGMKKDYVTDVLEKCGYSAEIGIAVLIDKSMVTIDQRSDVLDMHDLLQDMGRNIVIQESPNNPGKRSRLWSKEDIDLILTNNKGTEAIQGIVLSNEWCGRRWSKEAFSNMTQLKLLKLDSARFPHGLSCLPTSLKVLVCSGYPLKTLPLEDQQYEVVEINLTYSKIEKLWHGKKFLGKLKYLDLSYSDEMKQTPDISAVPVLETLVLEGCRCLTVVHRSVAHHNNLILLNLRSCSSLTSLPDKLEMRSLNELILDDCSLFQNLPEFGECMKNLSRLSLMNTSISIKKLPPSLGYLVGLKDLNLQSCANLDCLPDTIDGLNPPKILSAGDSGNLPSLRTLNLSNCHLNQKSFPTDFGHFPRLRKLDISGNEFLEIPTSIHELQKLRCLKLNNCQKLQRLPELPSSIRELEACHCDSLDISEFNILSNVRSVFVSPSQDPGQFLLEMLIPGSKIPSWFVHRQGSNSISIPCDYPLNKRLGIALCFRIQKFEPSSMQRLLTPGSGFAFFVRNGNNRFITDRNTPIVGKDSHLYIICLSNDYLNDGFHQSTCFEVSILKRNPFCKVSMTSAARWVSIEDIKDLQKSKIERQKKNRRNV